MNIEFNRSKKKNKNSWNRPQLMMEKMLLTGKA